MRLSAAGKGVLVAAYNPLAWSREVPLRVPLNTTKTCAWKVTGGCKHCSWRCCGCRVVVGRLGHGVGHAQPDAGLLLQCALPAVDLTACLPLAGPEGEEVASQLVGVAPGTWCLQQLLAGVNATCPATYGDAGGFAGPMGGRKG